MILLVDLELVQQIGIKIKGIKGIKIREEIKEVINNSNNNKGTDQEVIIIIMVVRGI